MRLQDCNFDVNMVVTAPFTRTEPEEEWVAARDCGAIPQSLYDFYRRANFLSFGTSPRFLNDPDNLLFSYFCLIMRSLMEALVDAHLQLAVYCEAEATQFDPANPEHRRAWTRESSRASDARVRKAFRDLLIALQTGLDSLSELMAILTPGRIPGLTVGRAQFTKIEGWLGRPCPNAPLIATPADLYLRELHLTLQPIVFPAPPEASWLPYMRLLRNKSAHLGSALFRKVVLRDSAGSPHVFIPREWPFLWEKHMRSSGDTRAVQPMRELLASNLLHQDSISYSQGLSSKVLALVDHAIRAMAVFYSNVESFEPNVQALSELQHESKLSEFTEFLRA